MEELYFCVDMRAVANPQIISFYFQI